MPDQCRVHWRLGHEPEGCAREAGCRMSRILQDLLGHYRGVQVDGQVHGREGDQTLRMWLLSILVALA